MPQGQGLWPGVHEHSSGLQGLGGQSGHGAGILEPSPGRGGARTLAWGSELPAPGRAGGRGGARVLPPAVSLQLQLEKLKGEILGVVVVESGWGSILPTVILANMMNGGPAARSGKLSIGDQITSVNGTSLVGLPLATCQGIIKVGTPSPQLLLRPTRRATARGPHRARTAPVRRPRLVPHGPVSTHTDPRRGRAPQWTATDLCCLPGTPQVSAESPLPGRTGGGSP